MQFLKLALNVDGKGTHELCLMQNGRYVQGKLNPEGGTQVGDEPLRVSRDLPTILQDTLDAMKVRSKNVITVVDPAKQFIPSGEMDLRIGDFRIRVHAFVINGGTVATGRIPEPVPVRVAATAKVAAPRRSTTRSASATRPAARTRRT
jgi:hypothetical protein